MAKSDRRISGNLNYYTATFARTGIIHGVEHVVEKLCQEDYSILVRIDRFESLLKILVRGIVNELLLVCGLEIVKGDRHLVIFSAVFVDGEQFVVEKKPFEERSKLALVEADGRVYPGPSGVVLTLPV